MKTRDKETEITSGEAHGATFDATVTGIDARRSADRVAEEAGRRARAAAKARGEETEEYGGPEGLEPTRYGDWEKAGRCTDF